jgi:hypothetical protein
MKRMLALLLLCLTGCSTAPVADLLDWKNPGCIRGSGPFYGGVAAPPPGTLSPPPTADAGLPPAAFAAPAPR